MSISIRSLPMRVSVVPMSVMIASSELLAAKRKRNSEGTVEIDADEEDASAAEPGTAHGSTVSAGASAHFLHSVIFGIKLKKPAGQNEQRPLVEKLPDEQS